MKEPRGRSAINKDAVLQARLRLGLTQEEVQQECARRGQPVWNLSRMENGDLKWPTARTIRILAEVLELDVSDFFRAAA
jgi:hypothetical protein